MSERILVVDDDAQVLESMKCTLRAPSRSVLTTTSPLEALALLGDGSFDLILSDENMPGVKGTKLLSIVAKRHPATMRIMLTGSPSLEVALRAINEGEVYRFLTKPCRREELLLTVNQALELKSLRTEGERLLRLARQQRRVLDRLEDEHPGITALESDDDGALVVHEGHEGAEEILRQAAEQFARTG